MRQHCFEKNKAFNLMMMLGEKPPKVSTDLFSFISLLVIPASLALIFSQTHHLYINRLVSLCLLYCIIFLLFKTYILSQYAIISHVFGVFICLSSPSLSFLTCISQISSRCCCDNFPLKRHHRRETVEGKPLSVIRCL